MPQYYFHTQTIRPVTDEDGLDLPDDLSARGEAIRTAGELLRDGVETFWGTRPWTITVTDRRGLILLEIEMQGHAAPALN